MVRKLMAILGLFLVIVGCQEKGLNLQITFDRVLGLKADDRVIFDENPIGRVTGLRYTEGGSYIVEVEIKTEFAEAVTEHARFFIVADPTDKTKKAIEMIQVRKGGTPLKNRTIVAGSKKHSALLDRSWNTFENGLEDLKEQFEEFSEEFQRIPESKAYKELEKELQILLEKIKQAGKSARGKIEKEVLPRLKEEIEKLNQRLLKQKEKEESEKQLEI